MRQWQSTSSICQNVLFIIPRFTQGSLMVPENPEIIKKCDFNCYEIAIAIYLSYSQIKLSNCQMERVSNIGKTSATFSILKSVGYWSKLRSVGVGRQKYKPNLYKFPIQPNSNTYQRRMPPYLLGKNTPHCIASRRSSGITNCPLSLA